MAQTRKHCRKCKHRHTAPRGKNCPRMPQANPLPARKGNERPACDVAPSNRERTQPSSIPHRGSKEYVDQLRKEIARIEILKETEALERRLEELQGTRRDDQPNGSNHDDKVDTPGVDSGLHTTDRMGAESPNTQPPNEPDVTMETHDANNVNPIQMTQAVTMAMPPPENPIDALELHLDVTDVTLPMPTISTWVATTSPTSIATHTTVTRRVAQQPTVRQGDTEQVLLSPRPLDYINGNKPMRMISYTEYIQACLKVLEIGLYTEPSAAIDYLHHVMFLAETAASNTCSTEAIIRYDTAFHNLVSRSDARFGQPDDELCSLYLRRSSSGSRFRGNHKYGRGYRQQGTFTIHKSQSFPRDQRHDTEESKVTSSGQDPKADRTKSASAFSDTNGAIKPSNADERTPPLPVTNSNKKNKMSSEVERKNNSRIKHQEKSKDTANGNTRNKDDVRSITFPNACRRWNYAKCNDAQSCRRDHVCCACGLTSHKVKACERQDLNNNATP